MCNNNEKIFCCTKFFKLIESFNAVDSIITKTYLVKPVLCREVCPEECELISFDETKTAQYVTTVASSCDECFKYNGCEINYAIFFNTIDCQLEEVQSSSLEEAQTLVTDTKLLVEFIPCLSSPLSKTDSALYYQLLTEQISKCKSCHKPCCYMLENDTVGCIKIPEADCNPENLRHILNTEINIVNTVVSGNNGETCEGKNCFNQTQNALLDNDTKSGRCGACCLGEECIHICDVDIKHLDTYIKNTLNINVPINNLLFENNIVSAQNLCKALQGNFLGYHTICGSGLCLKNRIIVT